MIFFSPFIQNLTSPAVSVRAPSIGNNFPRSHSSRLALIVEKGLTLVVLTGEVSCRHKQIPARLCLVIFVNLNVDPGLSRSTLIVVAKGFPVVLW